jgi:DNA modification methylase
MMTSLDRIICGDCVSVLEMFGADFVDLTLTSAGYEDARSYHGFRFDFRKIAKALWRLTKPDGVVVWILKPRATSQNGYSLGGFEQAIYFKSVGFRAHDVMLYRKRNPPSKRTNASLRL